MNIIFYFTGTGNSLHVARQIGHHLGETDLIRVSKGMKTTYEKKYERVGFVFPVYFGAAPYPMAEFMKNLEIQADYIFSVATCGGMAAGANGQVARQLKGLVNAAYAVTMASNNQTSYPPNGSLSLLEASDKKINIIAKEVRNRLNKPVSSSFSSIIAPLISRWVLPRNSDKNFQVDYCDGCGLCVKVCPNRNISLENKRPQWHHDCSRCTACLQLCPKEAIQYGASRKWGRYRHPKIGINDLILTSE